jgi:hypothetical protein
VIGLGNRAIPACRLLRVCPPALSARTTWSARVARYGLPLLTRAARRRDPRRARHRLRRRAAGVLHGELYHVGADLVEVVGGRFASAHRSRIAAAMSRLAPCSSLSFLAARFCLMVLLGFLTAAPRGDLSAMALPVRPGVRAPPASRWWGVTLHGSGLGVTRVLAVSRTHVASLRTVPHGPPPRWSPASSRCGSVVQLNDRSTIVARGRPMRCR